MRHVTVGSLIVPIETVTVWNTNLADDLASGKIIDNVSANEIGLVISVSFAKNVNVAEALVVFRSDPSIMGWVNTHCVWIIVG